MNYCLSVILCAWVLCSTPAFSQTYTTRFEGTEDPLSEGGRWTNNGQDWTRIRKWKSVVVEAMERVSAGAFVEVEIPLR